MRPEAAQPSPAKAETTCQLTAMTPTKTVRSTMNMKLTGTVHSAANMSLIKTVRSQMYTITKMQILTTKMRSSMIYLQRTRIPPAPILLCRRCQTRSSVYFATENQYLE